MRAPASLGDGAGVGRFDASQQLAERTFAGAVEPHHADALPWLDDQVGGA